VVEGVVVVHEVTGSAAGEDDASEWTVGEAAGLPVAASSWIILMPLVTRGNVRAVSLPLR
jgi:hypothetical protein